MKIVLLCVSVQSILTGATDANPANKVVQLLSNVEGKIQAEGGGQTTSREFSVWCKSQTSDLAFAVQTEQKDQADLEAQLVQLGATSEALRTKIGDFARSGDPMPIRWRQPPSARRNGSRLDRVNVRRRSRT